MCTYAYSINIIPTVTGYTDTDTQTTTQCKNVRYSALGSGSSSVYNILYVKQATVKAEQSHSK